MIRQFVKQLRNQLGNVELKKESVKKLKENDPRKKINNKFGDDGREIWSKWGNARMNYVFFAVKNSLQPPKDKNEHARWLYLLKKVHLAHGVASLLQYADERTGMESKDLNNFDKHFALYLGIDEESTKKDSKKHGANNIPTLADLQALLSELKKSKGEIPAPEDENDNEKKRRKSAQDYIGDLKSIKKESFKKHLATMAEAVEKNELYAGSTYKQNLVYDFNYVIKNYTSTSSGLKGMEKNDYWKVLLIKRFIIILR